MLFRYINIKKYIRSRTGLLQNSASNLETDNQSIANMLNKYFISAFNTTSGGDNIDTNDIDTNDVINTALVDSQDDTT